jgi:Arylsulfotransferase (ASST)
MIRAMRRLGFFAAGISALFIAGCGGNDLSASASQPRFAEFQSRPDLQPPTVVVEKRTRNVSPGYVFFAPKKDVRQRGPLIVDNAGRVVWFHPLHLGATDFRVQRYRGRPVLTWWQGRSNFGIGRGAYVIMNSSYRRIATVRAGNGLAGDEHEFLISPRGTALITAYRPVPGDLSSVGGPKQGLILDSVLQEIDIKTGRVVFEWHSVGRVGLDESYWKLRKMKGKYPPYDYFHINSIEVEPDGNLLVSARNTHALYEIDHRSGKVLWRLGGKRSDFEMGRGTQFNWQHDARRQRDGTISVFDDGAFPKVEDHSRALVLRASPATKKVTLVHAYVSPDKLLARHQGGMQVLPNGHVFVGWGSEPYFTEFARNGAVVFNAHFGKDMDSYRAYRFQWVGRPRDRPALVVEKRGGRTTAFVSWNGATQVTRWRIRGGPTRTKRANSAEAARTGFETEVTLPKATRFAAAQALDAGGRVLGRSKTVAVTK